MERVLLYDTTLRDGLRNSGISLTMQDKLQMARALDGRGVDAIEIGFGGPSEVESMQQLARSVDRAVVYGLTRVNRKDVDRVLSGVDRARMPGVNVFHPVSQQFLAASNCSPAQAVDRVIAAIGHARAHVDHVMFATQDASRAELDVVADICGAAIHAGATAVSIADTVSHALPTEFGARCEQLLARTVGADGVTWSVHCHNEIGLAVANCLAAIDHGVRQVECTINGIGEGAGNTPLQTIVKAISARADRFPAIASGDHGGFDEAGALLRRLIDNRRIPSSSA